MHDPPIKHVYKEQNMVADQLAKYGTTLVDTTMLLLHSPTSVAMDAYQADLQGVTAKYLVNACFMITILIPQMYIHHKH